MLWVCFQWVYVKVHYATPTGKIQLEVGFESTNTRFLEVDTWALGTTFMIYARKFVYVHKILTYTTSYYSSGYLFYS